MKRIKYFFLGLAGVLLIGGCKRFLDTTPKDGTITDVSFFKKTSDFDTYIFGAYADMAGAFDGSGVANWIKVTMFVSQEGVGPDEQTKPLAQYMSASNDQIGNYWINFFRMVSKANKVLEKLPASSIPDADKTRLEGEALFLRGFAYFNLARAFGNIPLPLKPYDITQNYIGCTSEDSVWNQVIADLSSAVTKIPTREEWSADNLGRATKGSAYAYLANAYMYKKDWANAESASASLIALGEYSLLPAVRSVFSVKNPNNDESIFEVQYRNISDGKVNWSGHEAGGLLAEWTAPRNIGSDWAPGGGWGETVANRKLADSYEPGDDRRSQLMRVPGEKYKGESMTDTLIIPLDVAQSHSAFSTKYWLGPSPEAGTTYLFKQNIPIMRYAEFLLNYAEILFMDGKIPEGYQQLNLVRERALLPDLTPQSD
ncbi:MAG: RagB/SusD family nutrient uptake outer membrane protein, partial [Chitinophagaceae bacterium]|nr:RagB/SusD family nutrient uptake outer membrane protein [Chitinophagaceae bacterium]